MRKKKMSDVSDENNPEEEESFADLFESYDMVGNEDLKIGDKIEGEIVSIGQEGVFVDTGTKIDGFVDKKDLLDDDGELPHSLGDKLELYVISTSESKIELSPGLSGIGGLMHLEVAWQNTSPIEGTVLDQCKGGFNVNVMGQRAFCPISQIDTKYVEDPIEYLGNTYRFLVSEFEENGRNIVVSRRDILKEEAEKASQSFYEDVVVGTTFEGKVTRVESYGAFVELLPTIEGMVHVSELSWSRIANPMDLLKVGDQVTVKLIGVERTEPAQRLKISLSIKQITANPWDSAEGKYNAGDKVTGKVTRCMDFGAFVEIAPGIEGLVHISEMSYTKRILKPGDVVAEGEIVSVMIKDVDVEKRRISLSLKDAEGDPWLDVAEKYPVGQSVEGTVEKKESFGLFIRLEPGVTGLLPKSKIADSYDAASIEKLKQGDAITIIVEALNPGERKITLGPGDSADVKNWKGFNEDKTPSLGTLGEKLQEALARNKKQ